MGRAMGCPAPLQNSTEIFGEGGSTGSLILIVPLDKYFLVYPVKPVGNQAQSEHHQDKTRNYEGGIADDETENAKGEIDNAQFLAAFLFFKRFAGDREGVKLIKDDQC
jgi:hypothetical protein